MTSETITVLANLALTLSLIVAVVFGIAQVRSAARDRKERLTLDVLRNFQSREFAELISFITTHTVPTSRDELRKLPEAEQVMFIQFAQQMESLGMLVAERLINLDLVDKTLGSFVTSSWERSKKLFIELRKSSNDPFLSEYFQWLAEAIEKRMKENPRKPFHERA
jgi:hypothetical protein